MIVGYARTSIVDQIAGFEAQSKELSAAGCEKIFREQVSSVTVRLQLQSALDFVRDGDVFVVTKLDRLARSVGDLMAILQALERKHVAVRILNLGMDTQTPTGKLMLTVLGGVAQFEREMMLERQREGIAKRSRLANTRVENPLLPSDSSRSHGLPPRAPLRPALPVNSAWERPPCIESWRVSKGHRLRPDKRLGHHFVSKEEI
jgi:DNA invertase Pin-like site-specific DNA recombinase